MLISGDAKSGVRALHETGDAADKTSGQLAKTGAASKKVGDESPGHFAKVGTAAQGVAKAVGGAALAVGGIAGVFIHAGTEAENYALSVGKIERLTGATADQSSILAYAAQQTGVDIDGLGKGIRKLSTDMHGNSDAFTELGVNTRNSGGDLKDTYEVMSEVADKFKDMEDGADKTALAQKLFGKTGSDLIPLLNGGSEALQGYKDEAEKYGLVLDDAAIKKAREAKGAQRDLSAAWEGLQVQLGTSVLPAMTAVSRWLAEELPKAVETGKEYIKQAQDAWNNLVHDFGQGPAENKTSNVGAFFDQQKTDGPFAGLAQSINPQGQDAGDELTQGWTRVQNAWNDGWAAFESGSQKVNDFFTGGLGLGEALGNGWQRIQNAWSDGVDAFKGGLKTLEDAFDPFSSLIIGALRGLGDVAGGLWNAITGVFSSVSNTIKALFLDIYDTLKGIIGSIVGLIQGDWGGAWDQFKGAVAGVFNFVKDTVGGIASAIGSVFSGIIDIAKGAWNGFAETFNNIHIPAINIDIPGTDKSINWGPWDLPDLPKFHSGGIYSAPTPGGEGMAWLRDGERVLPPRTGADGGSGGGPTVHIENLHLPGWVSNARDVARAIAPALVDELRHMEKTTR